MALFGLILFTASTVAGLHLPKHLNLALIAERASPTIPDDDLWNTTSALDLIKRTDPKLGSGDFGKNWDNESRREWLEDSFADAYTLALTAVNRFDSRIFNNYFPPKDENSVKAVFSAIVKSTDASPDDTEGADVLANFHITPVDFLKGSGATDFCAAGADAYMDNYAADGDHGNEVWGHCHFCDDAFGTEESPQAPLLDAIDCDSFLLTGPDGVKSYRVTNEMEPIGATLLHEFMHYNPIGQESGLPDYGPTKPYIWDVGGNEDTDPIRANGEPYWTWLLRQINTPSADICLTNADNYVWFALETYWTEYCAEQLASQGGAFNPPLKPHDTPE